ncbi:hypothetical protein Scep_007224 [Stephania cephalantha]|uniref:Uncharacterized protein n=1 Tax=Stephania cephalantha TaxID=152367 RepID=A0AAP0K9N2_9MAGN
MTRGLIKLLLEPRFGSIKGETECTDESGAKNTQNGVFICSDQLPEDLPQDTCSIVSVVMDSRLSDAETGRV